MTFPDKPTLAKMKYHALQQMAKKEGIRANVAKTVLIESLIEKHREDVFRQSSPAGKKPLGKVTKVVATSQAIDTNAPEAPKSKRRRTSEEPQEDSSSSHNTPVSKVTTWREGLRNRSQNSPSAQAPPPERVPGPKDLRRVKRHLVTLIDDALGIQDEIEEANHVLTRLKAECNTVQKGLGQIVRARQTIELFLPYKTWDTGFKEGTLLIGASEEDDESSSSSEDGSEGLNDSEQSDKASPVSVSKRKRGDDK